MRVPLAHLVALATTACSLSTQGTAASDGSIDATTTIDATEAMDASGATDATDAPAHRDGALGDAAPGDSGADGGSPDATVQDSTMPDATPVDAPPVDAPPVDAQPGETAPDASPPTGIVLGSPIDTTQQGGTGGSPFDTPCPGGQVVTGYSGTTSGWPASIQTQCGTLSIVGTGPWQIDTGPGATLATEGQTGTTPWTANCPPNQMIVGFSGRSGSWTDRLTFSCASLLISGDGSAVSVGPFTVLPSYGDDGGSPYPETDCPVGSIATGTKGRSGMYVDAIAVECSPVSLTH